MTDYCHARGLLTGDQYIAYRVFWQPGPSWGRNTWIPAVYRGDEMIYKLKEAPEVERGLDLPAAEELREKFLKITSAASPLRRVKDYPTRDGQRGPRLTRDVPCHEGAPMTETIDDDVEQKVIDFVLQDFSAPRIDSHVYTINGWEDFEIVEDEVEVKLVKKDEYGSWFGVRVRCEGEITFEDDADAYDEPPRRPRHYFLTGKVLVPAYEDDEDDKGEAEAAQPEWQERFPSEIKYEDLQGTGSYRRASWGPDDGEPE